MSTSPSPARRPLVVCYHDLCADSGCAAVIVQQQVPDAELIPVRYHQPLPDLAGRDVQFVDFCPEVDELVTLVTTARSLEVLDHHLSADDRIAAALQHPAVQAALADDPARFTYTFDLTRSGAMITWDRYHAPLPPPPLVAYVQDRDLWRHALPETESVNFGLFLAGMDPAAMQRSFAEDIETLRARGAAGLQARDARLDYYTARVDEVAFAGYEGVPAVALHPEDAWLRSDLGARLMARGRADGRPAPFVLIGIHEDKAVKLSLRGRKEPGAVDLKALAQRFGGGGHVDAASFQSATLPWTPTYGSPAPATALPGWASHAVAAVARPASSTVSPPIELRPVPPTVGVPLAR